EHMPYTSMLTLTYVLYADGGARAERLPDLRLRAYNDARLLEAESFQGARRGQRAGQGERELHQRWTRNMMLNKWLEYCAERGHRFIVEQSVG
ncbi:MAG: DUF1249 domain-containing protein, partial [Steroidobacteraceae bacterium]